MAYDSVQHRAHNLLTRSMSACLLASRLTIYRLLKYRWTMPSNGMPWRGDCGPQDLAVISLLSLRSFVDCQLLQALAGTIEAEEGISRRLIPRPMTKIACDLWSQELLLSLYQTHLICRCGTIGRPSTLSALRPLLEARLTPPRVEAMRIVAC